MEALQKVSDAPLTECPECHRSALTRLISAPSFRLKGGGWYETDFKSGSKRNLAESGDKPAAESKDKDKKPPKEGKEKPAPEPAKAAPAKQAEGKSAIKPAKAAEPK